MFPVEPVISPIQRFVKTLNLAGLAVLLILFVVSLPEDELSPRFCPDETRHAFSAVCICFCENSL